MNEVKEMRAMTMNVHYEACIHHHRVIQQIKEAGMKAAITLNPSTPVAMLSDIIQDLDMVLLMSVNPGFGGQKFIPHTLTKVKELKDFPCPRATVKRPNTVMPSAAPTCSAMATAARASRPLCSRATISMAKVEKVVSPPRKPVIMASRHSGARLGCRAKKAEAMPMR